MLSKTLIKYAATRFCLSKASIEKLVSVFPKIKQDVINLISDTMDRELERRERLPGMRQEHKQTTGLCGVISGEILSVLKEYYPVEMKQGFYIIDKHPRYEGKIGSMHHWLQVGNKIIDFTARQFQPFVNYPIDELVITDTANPHYTYYRPEDYIDVDLDDEYILNWYIENL